METFNYTRDRGSQKSMRPVVSRVQFGDGYTQRVAFGINTKPETWALSFTNRDAAEADAIDAFLRARGGVESFLWENPDGVTKTYLCEEWQLVEVTELYKSVTATFVETFDPV